MTGPEQSLDLDALEAVVRAWRSAPKVSEDKVERLRLLTEYRETFDPPTVLALIERVRRLERALRDEALPYAERLTFAQDVPEQRRVLAALRAALGDQD